MFSLQPPRHISTLPITSVSPFGPRPLLVEPDMIAADGTSSRRQSKQPNQSFRQPQVLAGRRKTTTRNSGVRDTRRRLH
jgi:hypothetical protein